MRSALGRIRPFALGLEARVNPVKETRGPGSLSIIWRSHFASSAHRCPELSPTGPNALFHHGLVELISNHFIAVRPAMTPLYQFFSSSRSRDGSTPSEIHDIKPVGTLRGEDI